MCVHVAMAISGNSKKKSQHPEFERQPAARVKSYKDFIKTGILRLLLAAGVLHLIFTGDEKKNINLINRLINAIEGPHKHHR